MMNTKKLSLHKETLRALSGQESQEIVGGGTIYRRTLALFGCDYFTDGCISADHPSQCLTC